MSKTKKKILLIDAMNIIFRAYYAFIQNPLRNSKGENTSALYGFTNMVLKLLNEEKPDYVCVVFDSPTPTFRKELYPPYKANREKPPDELVEQIPKVKHLCDILALPHIEQAGLEADDCIATIADEAKKHGFTVKIASSDKDLYQMIDDNLHLITTKKGITNIIEVDTKGVLEKFGIKPEQVGDYLSLVGDKSDNVPGVKGIGEKTAENLLKTYGSLDYILSRIDEIEPKTVAKKIKDDMANLELSRKLVTLKFDLPISDKLDKFKQGDVNEEEMVKFLQEMEFTSLIDTFVKKKEVSKLEYETISPDVALLKIIPGKFGFEIEGNIISLSNDKNNYILKINENKIADFIENLVEKGFKLSGHNLKRIYKGFDGLDFLARRFELDTELGAYLLTPEGATYRLEEIYFKEFGERLKTPEAYSSGIFEDEKIVLQRTVSRTEAIYKISSKMNEKLEQTGLIGVMRDIEMPLTPVLANMERRGILIDLERLKLLSSDVQNKINELEEKIYEIAGERFLITSPKQLSQILFEKLKLPTKRKTKTGYSTDSEVLTQLMDAHPIISEIIEHRTLVKLKSTYIDALPTYINPKTGRVHTTFLQTSTATGRLSSRDPNLQNIPIRTDLGGEIRKAFIADRGKYLVSSDYSQIELRILAHMSGDENLIGSFKRGEDIHTATAREIFPGREIDPELRRRAKAINFGLIYGKTPHGLSQELGITHEEAGEYISRYFERYPAVRQFMETLKKSAYEKGYSETIFGRRRYLPELKSENATIRSSAERAALNMPIQGTAADILKLAMIEIERILSERTDAQMLLTIHDELLFEVDKNMVEEVSDIIKLNMESVIELDVPVLVEVGFGENWFSAH
ncbi:MAG: DNA polymerase I [bacterium]